MYSSFTKHKILPYLWYVNIWANWGYVPISAYFYDYVEMYTSLNVNTMSSYYFCNNINRWLCLYEENKHLKYLSKSRIYVFFSLARGTTHHISWSSQKKRHSWVMLCVWNKIVVRHYVTMYVRSGYNFQKVITFLFLLSDWISFDLPYCLLLQFFCLLLE